jgi:hypothetical protein
MEQLVFGLHTCSVVADLAGITASRCSINLASASVAIFFFVYELSLRDTT